jgi:hypothetical protein
MSETNTPLAQGQQRTKPKIEDVIALRLKGNQQKNALDFVAFLRENKLSPGRMDIGSYAVKSKNKSVCNVYIHADGRWMMRFRPSTLENRFSDDEMLAFILDNIHHPEPRCPSCPGIIRNYVDVLGIQPDNVCNCWPVMIYNPDGKTLDICKKFVLYIKSIIADTYVPPKK